MGLLMWIVFGAIAGFLADMLDRSVTLSWVERVIVGIVGAMVGGTLYRVLTTGTLDLTASNNFDIVSMIVAVIGSLISVFVWKKMRRGALAG